MVFKNIKDKALNLTERTKQGLSEGLDSVIEVASDVKDTSISAASVAFDKTKETATNLSEKTTDFIAETAESTKEVAANVTYNLVDSKLDENESYCSWCFEKTSCSIEELNDFTRNTYVCDGCGGKVAKCRVCLNKARVECSESDGEVSFWSNNFCAVHNGEIARFETLKMKLDSIAEFRYFLERRDKNFKKIIKTSAVSLGGAAVIAPAAFLAAPAIGGAVGVNFLGLSGAAATNSGLAALGGGAIKAGGAGMAGGVSVVTAGGSALGGVSGAVVSNSYYGDIDGFDIVKIQTGIEPTVICIDGFLTQDNNKTSDEWIENLSRLYSEHNMFQVRWESKRLLNIAGISGSTGMKRLSANSVKNFAASATKVGAKTIMPLGILFQTLGLAKNPWSVASVKAFETGILLADIIARTDKKYILIGHSLGARVIYACLSALKTKASEKTFISEVHLLGGAVNNCMSDDSSSGINWRDIETAVDGRIHNYYSKNDSVLKNLYPIGEGLKLKFGDPIGRNPIPNEQIINVDVTDIVSGHTAYKSNLYNILSKGLKLV